MGRGKGTGNSSSSSQDHHKIAKKAGQGVQLVSQTKQIVENVRKFFENEKQYGMSLNRSNVIGHTAKATQLSTMTVKRIHKEFVSHEGQFLTPVKRYTVSRIRTNRDGFDCGVIRKVVHDFYEHKEYPTLSLLLDKVKEA